MIKVEVTKEHISILGHAMYDDYGKDIVCAAVSSIVTTSVESIAAIDNDAITDKLINNMLNLLHELENKYPKNIKITNKEE